MKTAFIVLMSFFSLVSSTAYAGSVGHQVGKVTYISERASDGIVYFMLTGSPDSKPVCAKLKYWMIKDPGSTIGKLQISLLMEAYAANKTVSVVGTGTCTVAPDGEDANEIEMYTPGLS